jgi:AhpD family alkylhydroperoxidase
MIRWLLHRALNNEERKVGESVDYLRHIANVSPGALVRFATIGPFANCRKVLPADAWFTAQVVASQREDCGTCLQIVINLARQAGVDRRRLRAVLDGDPEALPDDLADVYRFTRAVIGATGDEDRLRETLRNRYGERGLVELAYAIAASRIPPTVKRALGYSKSCSAVGVDV